MNVLFFLQMRTKFLRDFYSDASFPFSERKRKIEAGEDPFEPPYSEDTEPPFLTEWIDADESLEVLGQMCVSMLAATLHLYVKERINKIYNMRGSDSLIRISIDRLDKNKSSFKKRGWINGYRTFFREKLGIDWAKAPSNLELLEQIVLARNSSQHPQRIDTLKVTLSKREVAKRARSFFVDEEDLRQFAELGKQFEEADEWTFPLRLNITQEKLLAAIDEVDRFCIWLEDQRPR